MSNVYHFPTVCPLLLLALGSFGCELGSSIEGLGSALGGAANNTTAESPGKRLSPESPESPIYAEGFSNFLFAGGKADGSFLVALTIEGQDKPGRLLFIPYGARATKTIEQAAAPKEGCSVGAIVDFAGPQSPPKREGAPLEAKLPFISAPDGETPATLHFTDFACNVIPLEIPMGGLPFAEFGESADLLVREGSNLWAVNLWDNAKRRISSNVTRASLGKGPDGDQWLWSVEDHEIVARNTDYEEVFRAGHNVADKFVVDAAGTPSMRLMFETRDEPPSVLTFLVQKPEELTTLADDACGPQFYTGTRGLEALLESPCESGDIKLYSFDKLKEDAERLTDLATGVNYYSVQADVPSGPVLLFRTPGSGDQSGALYGKWGSGNPVLLGYRGRPDMSQLWEDGRRRAVVNWDNTKGGDLIYGAKGEDETQTIASNLREMNGQWITADVSENKGNLYKLQQGKTSLFHKDVVLGSLNADPKQDRALFVSDFDGNFGSLYLAEGDGELELTGDVRPPGTYTFTDGLKAITALVGEDNDLKLHDTRGASDLTVDTHVGLALEVFWPENGLLYATAGDSPGIFFSKFIP